MHHADRISGASATTEQHHPKKVIATPDSAGVQKHSMLVANLFLWWCTQLHRHDVGGCMRLERTSFHWPEAAKFAPLTPPRRFRVSRCPAMASSCRDHQGFLAVFVFPCPGAVPRECRDPLFSALWLHRGGPLTMDQFFSTDRQRR